MRRLTAILLTLPVFLIIAGCQTIPREGQGKYTFADGSAYVGEFKNGKANGQGTIIIANGDKYIGEFRDNIIHGKGIETTADGRKYVVGYKDGKRHGPGTVTTATGDKFVGQFKNDTLNGWGILTLANGDKFVGEFKDGKRHGPGTATYVDGRVQEGIWENGTFKVARKVSPKRSPKPEASNEPNPTIPPKIIPKKSPIPKIASKPEPTPHTKSSTSGSGFFVSKLGHLVTNEHVVRRCKLLTVGDNSKTQVRAVILETDKRNDLALLKISSTEMASAETKSLIRKLGLRVVPLSSSGLLRSEDVELGESLLVGGFPYGEIFSNSIKVTTGIVSAIRGIGDDSGQFQMDAAVQPGSSGGPIYDENGNIVGVVVAQLDKLKVAKAIGSLPENVNFGIKASTVRQFLTSAGLPTKWSARLNSMSTRELAKIAKNQTVMIICSR